MQLDTAIEQRKREITNVSNDINNEKDQNEQISSSLFQGKIDLLNKQLDRAKANFTSSKFRVMGDRYNEIATGKSPPSRCPRLLTALRVCRPVRFGCPGRAGGQHAGPGEAEESGHRASRQRHAPAQPSDGRTPLQTRRVVSECPSPRLHCAPPLAALLHMNTYT